MPSTIRPMHLELVLRDVQTDRGSLLHGRLLVQRSAAIGSWLMRAFAVLAPGRTPRVSKVAESEGR